MSAEQEVAALRLMLREMRALDATGIDYALICQRQRDAARREIATLRTRAEQAEAERDEFAAQAVDRLMLVASLRAERDVAQRELHRLIHGTAIEGDGACEHEIHADAARAWSRLWHREARRLWREVQALSGDLSEEHREVMRLRSVIRRYLRTNPPHVEALRDLLFRSADGDDIDADREVASARAEALREAADIARAHGGISAYYALHKLAAEVEP